ncbi:MAG: hypothetical protein F6J93_28330 [Oscillatoria sp. SIO1A7]|nr:hypothetical protein [Oscillatoria sp. SIO1A7]
MKFPHTPHPTPHTLGVGCGELGIGNWELEAVIPLSPCPLVPLSPCPLVPLSPCLPLHPTPHTLHPTPYTPHPSLRFYLDSRANIH